jgi:hypothetical protein
MKIIKKIVTLMLITSLLLTLKNCGLLKNKAYENFKLCKENTINIYNCINIYNYEYMNN